MIKDLLYKTFLFIKTHINELLILMASFIFIGLFSMSSPIYLFNDMADANTWMIQGKMILDGQILYKDVYEHKGPIQLIPYVVAAIFDDSFFALYIIESLLFFVYGLFIYKVAKLYCKSSLIITLLTMFFTSSSITFLCSGTTEELTLFIYPASLYIILKALKEGRYLNKNNCIVIGIMQGLLLWSKYTLCSFTIGLCLFMIYWHIKDHENITKRIIWFLMGVGIPTAIIIIYFACVGAIKDLFQVYFYNTIFVYGMSNHQPPKISTLVYFRSIYYIYGVVLFLCLISLLFKIKKIKKLFVDKRFVLIIISFLTTFICDLTIGRRSNYYALTTFPYIVFPLIAIFNNKSLLFKTIIICLSLYITIDTQNTHLEKLQYSKDDFVQFEIYDYINSSGKHKILTRTNNSGFFYYTDNLPFNRYFTNFCIDLDDLYNETDYIISEGIADFIITDKEEEFEKYHIAIQGTAPAHNPEYKSLEFQLKDVYYLYERN